MHTHYAQLSIRSMSATHSNSSEVSIRNQIIDYFARYPQAGDTMEGILGFWLKPPFEYDREEVSRILAEMVLEGLITSFKAGDGRVHYRARNQRNSEP